MEPKKDANDWSVDQFLAETLPHFWAIKLSFSASERPIALIDFKKLLSINPSNLPTTAKILLAKYALRTFSATFIVKSTSTLSILGKALNHTPARMALHLIFISCVLLSTLEEPTCRGVTLSLHPIEPLFAC